MNIPYGQTFTPTFNHRLALIQFVTNYFLSPKYFRFKCKTYTTLDAFTQLKRVVELWNPTI